jgi:hypothetical protein
MYFQQWGVHQRTRLRNPILPNPRFCPTRCDHPLSRPRLMRDLCICNNRYMKFLNLYVNALYIMVPRYKGTFHLTLMTVIC